MLNTDPKTQSKEGRKLLQERGIKSKVFTLEDPLKHKGSSHSLVIKTSSKPQQSTSQVSESQAKV